MSTEHSRGRTESDGNSEKLRRLEGCRIVIAEPDEAQRRMLKRLLESEGSRVSAFADNAEVVAKLFRAHARDDRTDIVILSANAPRVMDVQAIHRLRDGGFRRPVLAMAWPKSKDDRIEYAEAGYDEFVAKPISREILMTTLETLRPKKS